MLAIKAGGFHTVEKDKCLIKAPTEGGAVVHYDGFYYYLGSALTGWSSNPNKYDTAKSLVGPWSEFKDITPPEKNLRLTVHDDAQVTSTKTNTAIFMGDMWQLGFALSLDAAENRRREIVADRTAGMDARRKDRRG